MKKKNNNILTFSKNLFFIIILITLTTPIFITTYLYFSLYSKKQSLVSSSFSASADSLVDELPSTGNTPISVLKPTSQDVNFWDTYENSIFGFSFQYPKGVIIKELGPCINGICRQTNSTENTVLVNNLRIYVYQTRQNNSLIYDEGYDASQYKKPIPTEIGEIPYYYIVSKTGNIDAIVHEYKYLDNILWTKTEREVSGDGNTYFISFRNNYTTANLSESDIERLDKFFQTFIF